MATPRKKPEDLLKVGRPSLYKPEYCEKVIELGREGKSLVQIASHFDVTRQAVLEWANQHPEFFAALERARVHAQNWWENQAQAGMHAKIFNSKVWEVSVRARFREDYTERREVDARVQINEAPSEALMSLLAMAEKARDGGGSH